MLEIPVSQGQFKRDFLGGGGKIAIQGAGGGFDPLRRFEEGKAPALSLSTSVAGSGLKFGTEGGLACEVSFAAGVKNEIALVWPGEKPEFLASRGLEGWVAAGNVGALLKFDARLSAAAEGRMPVGPASLSFGAKAGASVLYQRLCVYPQETVSGALLKDLVTGIRMPQNAGTAKSLPGQGEILVFGTEGFLELSTALNWGYELSGSRDIGFSEIDAVIEYDLRLKAGLSAGYKLGGSHFIEARQGAEAGWVRLTVRKARDTGFDAAVFFGLDAKYELKGLPGTADEFLTAIFGADARAGLDLFEKARKFSNLDELEAASGKLLKGTVHKLAQKWLGQALDTANAQRFFTILNRAIQEYDQLDKTVSAAIFHLYEDAVSDGKQAEFKAALEKVAALGNRDALKGLSDTMAWELIQRLAGGDLFELLQKKEVFAKVVETARTGLKFMNGETLPELKDLIDELKESLGLKKVFDELRQVASKDKLVALADERLQGFVERILGKTWKEIKSGKAGKAAEELKLFLDKVESFKNTWYERLKEASKQSISLKLNAAYSRATTARALVDVEIDVRGEQGRKLYSEAARGNLAAAFEAANAPIVNMHDGALTHSIEKTHKLSVSVFGWEHNRLLETVAQTELSLEASTAGAVTVFTTEAAFKARQESKDRNKRAEILQSNFVMRLTGEAFRPGDQPAADSKHFLARSLRNMSMDYRYFVDDDLTTTAELTEYLALAEKVGLVKSAAEFAAQLAEQFPKGLGKVTARYVISYNPDAIRDAFTAESGEGLRGLVRETCRQAVAAATLKKGEPWLALTTCAYLRPDVQQTYYREGFTAVRDGHWSAMLPNWLGGGSGHLTKPQNQILVTFLNFESSLAERLDKLDQVIDRAREKKQPVPGDELEKAAREFVEKAGQVEQFYKYNVFFPVLDRLLSEGSGGKGYRDSAMILEITPPNATEKVTKYLTASPVG